ncbi:MAG: glycosyltransferase family 39 protein [Deltaproteobacteria bacterium]|nr:glycosyltransferase family 39 protein [Deltaproteobacteria bacterium]
MAKDQWGRDLLLLLAVSLPFIFVGVGSFSFLDPDEGMYGAIAREMAEGGDWITPHFNGVRYLEKPPLHFWLSALTISLFGPSEWAVRLWSGIPALGTVILIWRMGEWLYGRHAGLLAGIIFATSVGVFRYVHVAATDFLLVFSLTLSLFGFIRSLLFGRGGRTDYLLFYFGAALAVLSKGLIGLVFPILMVGLFLCQSRVDIKLSRMNLKWGLLLFFGLTLPWHLLAGWNNSGFLWFYFADNQFLRFLNSRGFIEDDVPVKSISLLVLTLIWFFPWSLFLPVALRQGFPRFRAALPQNEGLRFLVGIWALGIMVFFSLSSSKLEHYSLPAIPALSLMVGGRWAEALSPSGPTIGLKWSLGVGAVLCLLVGLSLVLLSDGLTPEVAFAALAELNVYYRILQEQGLEFPFSAEPFIPLLRWLGLILAVGSPLAYLLFRIKRFWHSFTVFVGISAGIAILVFRLDLLVESHHSSKSVAHALLAQFKPGDIIVHEGSLEYSAGLPFYTQRQIHVLNGKRGDLDFGSRYPEARDLFLDNGKFAALWEGSPRVFLITRPQVRESALKKLPSEKIFPIGQYDSRWLYTNQRSGIVNSP